MLLGISLGDTLPWLSAAALDSRLADIAAIGFKAIRMDFDWSEIQPDNPTVYHWSRIDRVVSRAKVHGLKVLGILTYTPGWAQPPGGTVKSPPVDPVAYANFCGGAARRYGPKGVHLWELWNEPNLTYFWSTPDPVAFSKLAIGAARAIRRADRSAFILSGGLAALDNADGNISQLDFLDAMLANGIARYIDGIAYHPYTYPFPASYQATWPGGTPWSKLRDTDPSFATVMAKHGVSKPIWLTEFGAPTGGPGISNDGDLSNVPPGTDHVTEQWQAVMAADVVKTVAATPQIGGLFWYTYADFDASGDPEGSYGIRRMDGSAKPAWGAFKGIQ